MMTQPAPNREEAEEFANDLLRLGRRAEHLGLSDYTDVLDALHTGVCDRLGLVEVPVPFTVVGE